MKRLVGQAIHMSALAYSGPDDIHKSINDQYGDVGYSLTHIDNEGSDTQGFICELDKAVWIVIRGTEFDSANDWLTNLDCSFTEILWGSVHRGFYKDAMSVADKAAVAIWEAGSGGKNVVITGHSQGAAVAEQLFALCAQRTDVRHVRCISVEAPRSFGRKAAKLFGNRFGKSMWQVVHNNDVVPMVPTTWMGYRHVEGANLQYIDRLGVVHASIPWYKRWKDRIFGLMRDVGDLDLDCIGDHDVVEIGRIWERQM